MKKNQVVIIKTKNDNFLKKKKWKVKDNKDINFIAFVFEDTVYVYNVIKKTGEDLYFSKDESFIYDINLENLSRIGRKSSFISFLNVIYKNEKKIVYMKNESEYFKQHKINISVIPVFEKYSKKNDNLNYFLKSFKRVIDSDVNHPLYDQFERVYIKILSFKVKELIQLRKFTDVDNIISENEKFFKKDISLKFLKALLYYNKNELYAAAEILFEVVEDEKVSGEAVVLLSRILDDLEKTIQALKVMEDYLAKGNVEEIFVLEYLRLLLKTEKIEDMGEILKKFSQMFESNEESQAYYKYYKGIFNMIKGNIELALEMFESIKGSNVDDIYLRLNILQIYKLMGYKEKFFKEKKHLISSYDIREDIKKKIELWEKELDDPQDFGEAVDDNNISDSQKSAMLEIKKAISEAEKFVDENPKNPWGFYSLGSLFLKIEDLDKAEECFKNSLGLMPENSIVEHGLGIIYVKRNKNKEAIEFFKKAIISRPDQETQEIYSKWNYDSNLAYFSLADSYIRLKKIDEAIVVLKKGLEFDAKSYMPHFQLGTCYEYKKEYFKALECYINVRKLNAEFYLVNFYISNCYMMLKDYNKALEFMNLYLDNDKELIYKDYALEVIKKITEKLD